MNTRIAWLLVGMTSGCAEDACPYGNTPLGTLTQWEQTWLDAGGAPESPEAETLLGEDGLQLAYRDWVPADWTGEGAVAVVVPGAGSHSEPYGQLGATMSELGVYTRIIDVRGHGRSVCESVLSCVDPAHTPRQPDDNGQYYPGRVGDSADPGQLARDLGDHLSELRDLWPAASQHLVGHSSGGGLVSRYVEMAGARGLASVALLAPYNHPDQPQVRPAAKVDCSDTSGTDFARTDTGALGDALRGNPHRYVLTLHKGPALTEPLDTLAYSWTASQAMSTTDPEGFWRAHTAPLLVVAAQEDALFDPMETARQAGLAAGPSEYVEVTDTSHMGLAWSAEVATVVASHIRIHPTAR